MVGARLSAGQCLTKDTSIYGYGGEIDVESDIQNEPSLAPDASQLVVCGAANDFSGQTE